MTTQHPSAARPPDQRSALLPDGPGLGQRIAGHLAGRDGQQPGRTSWRHAQLADRIHGTGREPEPEPELEAGG